MIVTCPGCNSKYRVRNDAVPADGARMKCPKCSTLFLAKPPAGGAPPDPADDPSSLFQQLNPATVTGPQAPVRLPPPQPPPQQQAGPITSLFQAFDASQLPPEMQRPPQQQQQAPQPPPQPPGDEAPSGLQLDTGPRAPQMRLPPPTQAPVTTQQQPPPSVRAVDVPRREAMSFGPSRGQVIASWAALVLGAAAAAFGAVFFAWSTEAVDLDDTMMPLVAAPLGHAPPSTSMSEPSADELRHAADAAEAAGDLPRAVVLWRRVKERAPAAEPDARAKESIPRLLSTLGDINGVPP